MNRSCLSKQIHFSFLSLALSFSMTLTKSTGIYLEVKQLRVHNDHRVSYAYISPRVGQIRKIADLLLMPVSTRRSCVDPISHACSVTRFTAANLVDQKFAKWFTGPRALVLVFLAEFNFSLVSLVSIYTVSYLVTLPYQLSFRLMWRSIEK